MKESISTLNSIKEILIKHNIWLSVAESLTCGKLQSSFGEISGISKCFRGGITAYTIDEKVNLLKIKREEAKEVNCVSENIAWQMAKGVSEMFHSEIGIGTTGYAEKSNIGGEPHCYFAIYMKKNNSESEIIIKQRIDGGKRNRIEFQKFIVETILNELLTVLEKKL
ncbi:nicotinamide-nucleotide amidohydrolase family protein [Polaribacter sp. Z014]|uniref:CinA family protein n=1 Tax=Polaribacter sp. Z014 TaxID=2927126 RepID=UPI0020218FED|nr:nicotinamide-nucleotide amidohydrolase family protein [Polaribacter sp. Z014]MCL7765481.1 nicotinamide-nucleotide amidohydrolase family protein [Polaribacter sp. Z014]